MMENRIYNMCEEVKNVVVGIEQYRCRVNLDNHFYTDKIDKDFILKRAEGKAAYDLLDGIRQFIRVSQHLDRGYIESEISLPYVKDGVIRRLEEQIKYQDKRIVGLLKTESWWKKLFGIVK